MNALCNPAVADDELTRAVGAALGRPVAHLGRAPSPYRTSHALEDLQVRFADGIALPVLFKDLGPAALTDEARAAKPDFVCDPRREIAVYRDILGPERLGTAECYGAVCDPAAGRFWLFLEKVPGRELYQIGEFDLWRRVAEWLAAMHARFAPRAGALGRSAPLLVYDADYYRTWLRRALDALGGATLPAATRAGLARLAAGYDRVVAALGALPATLLHGEFYASNVLVAEAVSGTRVCPVDWEMAAVGPGLVDLAALTAGRWTEGQRTELALAYRAAYPPSGTPPEPAAFLTALDYCRLHVALQWLGWSPGWTPPPEHAQDWLGEAVALAEKLEL